MNTLAHGLLGVALTPKQNKNWTAKAIIFSMLPDLIWLPFMGVYLFFTKNPVPHSWSDAPIWFFQIYSLAHSLVIWLTIFVLSSSLLRKIQWGQLFWALHILIDIPGHINFTTAFLYPVSTYQYHGSFSWEANPALVLSFLIPMTVIFIRYVTKKQSERIKDKNIR